MYNWIDITIKIYVYIYYITIKILDSIHQVIPWYSNYVYMYIYILYIS